MSILIRDENKEVVEQCKKLTSEKTGAKAAEMAMACLPGHLRTIKEQEETIKKQRSEIIQLKKELSEIRNNLKGVLSFASKE